MKNEALYNKTVDILVQAYIDDTLVHGCQCGCAVGNIVASNCGIKINKNYLGEIFWYNENNVWEEASWFAYIKGFDSEGVNTGKIYNKDEAIRQIESTGYTPIELDSIERAFEDSYEGYEDNETMWNGLMAVIDALDNIHENTNTEITDSVKGRFVKQTV